MRASDSTNSLTELTRDELQEPSCFICLAESELYNPLVDSKLLRNCGCRFHVHAPCWNTWIKDKTDYDCPICRKNSILRIKIPPNPVSAIEWVDERQSRGISGKCKLISCIFATGVAAFLISSIVLWG